MYQLTTDPDAVLHVPSGELIPRGHRLWDDYELWVSQGNSVRAAAPPFEPNSPAHYRYIRTQAWEWMTNFIQERRYDSIETCCSYFNSSVPRYRDEARAMVEWRDAVNQALEAMVLAAPPGIETWEQVRDLLPQPEAFIWPAEVSLPLDGGESAALP